MRNVRRARRQSADSGGEAQKASQWREKETFGLCKKGEKKAHLGKTNYFSLYELWVTRQAVTNRCGVFLKIHLVKMSEMLERIREKQG